MAIQSYGDQLHWNPHLHSVVSEVAWDRQGATVSTGWPDSEVLTRLFQQNVLDMLRSEHRLSREFAHQLRSWHPSGFQVYCGPPVGSADRESLERLTAYILRPSFAATRLDYDSEEGQIE